MQDGKASFLFPVNDGRLPWAGGWLGAAQSCHPEGASRPPWNALGAQGARVRAPLARIVGWGRSREGESVECLQFF